MGIADKIGSLLKKGNPKSGDPMDRYLSLVKKEPGNATAHLRLAELYQKKGEKKKAVAEYLMAAEIFLKNQFYARAMAIYKQVPKQDPSLDHVYLKIADIYRKMGFTGDAFAQYRVLAQHYNSQGLKEKALEVLNLMADMDPQRADPNEKVQVHQASLKSPEEPAVARASQPQPLPAEPKREQGKPEFFDLGAILESAGSSPMNDFKEISQVEKVYGFEEIFKELKENSGPSAVDPNFNYNLGVASRELGFLEDAIEQFQVALEKNQNAFEAATLMSLCYKEKGQWSEAAQALKKALQIQGIPKEKMIEVKYELGLICKQEGKTDEALGLMREILAVDQKFRDAKNEFTQLMEQGSPQGKSLA
ncbi:MAG TPA: tetratricopeptide repeat protein [Thermodesulfobacteriota bacterium]|nr:tetratricopeptide repeat protein [Thermodesulfobacteriota bacterium]